MHTRSSQRRHPGLLAAALLSLVTAGACGSDPDTGGSGGSGGSGGAGGSGGRGGTGGSGGSGGASGSGGSGGATGSGGSSATGGVGGGSGGSGGTSGSGGAGGAGGAGGGGSGGSAGSGGSGGTGGSGGAGGGTQDARMETGADVPAGGTIESCFANLRAGMGSYQVGTKTSADGKVRYRLALETADRFGTSGTKPWGAYRFAIETPNVSVCVTQSGLFSAYKTTHHNCMDTFEVTAQGRRYVIEAPDFDGNRAARVSVSEGSLILSDKVQVLPTACTGSTTPCRSGGPC